MAGNFNILKDVYYNSISVSNTLKLPTRNVSELTNPVYGEIFIDSNTNAVEYYNGTTFVPIADITLESANTDPGTYSLVADGTGPELSVKGLVAGAGISILDNTPVGALTISSVGDNVTLASASTAPGTIDQVVDGAGPDMTIKGVLAGAGISIDDNSPTGAFTINSTGDVVSLVSANTDIGVVNQVVDGTGPDLSIKGVTGGVGISIADDSPTGAFTINSTGVNITLDPATTAPGTINTVVAGVGPNMTVKPLFAGTGVTLVDNSPINAITIESTGTNVSLAPATSGMSIVDPVSNGVGPALSVKALVGGTGINLLDNTPAGAITIETSGGGSISVPVARVSFVDKIHGDNATAEIGNMSKPWKTLEQAVFDSTPTVVDYATAAPLSAAPVLPGSYTSGPSGVLTEPGPGTALSIDGVSMTGGEIILVKDEPAAGGLDRVNGVYTVTNPGGVGVPWVLTRYAPWLESDATSLNFPRAGRMVIVKASGGATNDDTRWVVDQNITNLNAADPGGSDSVTFTQLDDTVSNALVYCQPGLYSTLIDEGDIDLDGYIDLYCPVNVKMDLMRIRIRGPSNVYGKAQIYEFDDTVILIETTINPGPWSTVIEFDTIEGYIYFDAGDSLAENLDIHFKGRQLLLTMEDPTAAIFYFLKNYFRLQVDVDEIISTSNVYNSSSQHYANVIFNCPSIRIIDDPTNVVNDKIAFNLRNANTSTFYLNCNIYGEVANAISGFPSVVGLLTVDNTGSTSNAFSVTLNGDIISTGGILQPVYTNPQSTAYAANLCTLTINGSLLLPATSDVAAMKLGRQILNVGYMTIIVNDGYIQGGSGSQGGGTGFDNRGLINIQDGNYLYLKNCVILNERNSGDAIRDSAIVAIGTATNSKVLAYNCNIKASTLGNAVNIPATETLDTFNAVNTYSDTLVLVSGTLTNNNTWGGFTGTLTNYEVPKVYFP